MEFRVCSFLVIYVCNQGKTLCSLCMFPDVDGRSCMGKVKGEFFQLSLATAHKNILCIRTCCERGDAARPFTWGKKKS
jgi:hypothetical protein